MDEQTESYSYLFMNDNCPKELDGAEVIAYAFVGAENKRTGNTKHIVEGMEMGSASAMVIAKYSGEECYYVFGCYTDMWEVITDTCHQDLKEAINQLDWEYEGLSKNLVWYRKNDFL